MGPFPKAPPEDDPNAPVVGSFPKNGRRTALTLVLFGIERVVIENFRQHPPIHVFGGLTEYQALAVILLVIGILIELFIRPGRDKSDKGESNTTGDKAGKGATRLKKKKHA